MNTSSLYRLGAIACAFNALLLVVSDILPAGVFAGSLNLFAGIFHLLALPALYLHQRRESGLLGAIGYIVNTVGLTLLVGTVFSSVFVLELIEDAAGIQPITGADAIPYIASVVLFVTGAVLFAIATFRAGVFARGAAILYGLGFFTTLFVTIIPALVLTLASIIAGAGMLWFGYQLWSA